MKTYYVYIITNYSKTLYIGITNDIEKRLFEHRSKIIPGFSSKYNIDKLVYLEETLDVNAAIAREKQLKGWVRAKKIALIEKDNPNWIELQDVSTPLNMTERKI